MAVKFESDVKAIALCLVFLAFAAGCIFLTGERSPRFKSDDEKTDGILSNGGKVKPFRLFRAVLLCLFFTCGAANFATFAARYQKAANSGAYSVTARVEEAREYDTSLYLILNDLSFDSSAADGKLRLCVYKSDAPQGIAEGSTVEFDAKITANVLWKDSSEENVKNASETRVYEWRKDIKYEAKSCKNLRVTGEDRNAFEKIRLKLKQTLEFNMDDDSSALCFAILTGETAEINGRLLDNFRYGGVAHIFAVSGLHVGALFAFITAIFRKGKLAAIPPVAKWTVAAALLAFYGGICGYSSGVIRAAVTCLTAYADRLLGVKNDSAESTAKAAIIVLILSPVSLFDAGFLLSFSAVFGILFLAPSLRGFFFDLLPQKSDKVLLRAETIGESSVRTAAEKIFSYLSVTLAATAATAPVLSACFNYVSGVSLLLNAFIVPLIGAAFPICLCVAFLSLIFAPFAQIALYIPSAAFSAISTLFYAFEFSRFTLNFSFTAYGTFFCFAALLSFSDKFNVKIITRAVWFALSFVALIVSYFI